MTRKPSPPARLRQRRGYSLLELLAATVLVGVTLVSSLELVREGLDLSVETDRQQLLANYAASKVEEHLALVAHDWTSGTFAGDFAADGLDSIRHTTVRSDDAIDGGVPSLLMSIRSTAYYDADGDDAQGTDELSCTFQTKIGRFATYEAL